MSNSDSPLRQQLLTYFQGGHAHAGFDKAVADLPAELRGGKPAGQPHTPWRLVEHMRLAQWDILEIVRHPHHKSPAWPDGYWPAGDAPPDSRAWEEAVAAFHTDLSAFEAILADPANDLLAPIPHGTGQTLFREALLVIDHTGYHVAQLILLRRLLGAWEECGRGKSRNDQKNVMSGS
jgi:hypothetical protein